MSDDEVREFLIDNYLGVFGTAGSDGAPHLVNVGYGLQSGYITVTSYGRSQKVVNARRTPRASILIETREPYLSVRGVLVSGAVEVLDDPAAALAAARHIKRRQEAAHPEGTPEIDLDRISQKRVALLLKPERIVSWDHRRLGGTY